MGRPSREIASREIAPREIAPLREIAPEEDEIVLVRDWQTLIQARKQLPAPPNSPQKRRNPFGAPTKYGKGGVAEPRTKARATSSLLGTELLEGVEVFWVVPGKCQTPGCTFSK